MIEIISPDTKIDFIGVQRQFLMLSGVVLAACILGVVFIGPTYGIDFRGGTELIVKFDKDLNTKEVREAMEEAGFKAEQVQRYGGENDHEFLVQTKKVSVVGPKRKQNAEPGDIPAEAVIEKVKSAASVQEWEWAKENPDRLDLTFEEGSDIPSEKIISAVEELGLMNVELKSLTTGGLPKYVIRFEGLQASIEDGLTKIIPEAFNIDREGSVSGIKRMETVGPRVGEQLRNSGILSILVALFCILVYVAFRFDLRYAPGAVAALTHDVIVAVGFFTFTGLEITLPIIAALLTIIGYSLNDTIVVFDRIRENLESSGAKPIAEVSNRSINETLSRTLITSLTTLLAVVAIAILGSGLIQNFAIALIVGVIVGTYSSVFVATPVMLRMDTFLKEWREARAKADKAKSSSAV